MRAKVISLAEFREKKDCRQRSLRSMIEGHLAEAGLLDKEECLCSGSQDDMGHDMENCWEPWDSEMGVETTER